MKIPLDESQERGKHSKAKKLSDSEAEVRFKDGPGLMHTSFV
jgi:hypothetical protein